MTTTLLTYAGAVPADSAAVFPSEAVVPASVPGEGVTLLDGVAGIELAGPVEGDYLHGSKAWSAATGRSGDDVLGQWGGDVLRRDAGRGAPRVGGGAELRHG